MKTLKFIILIITGLYSTALYSSESGFSYVVNKLIGFSEKNSSPVYIGMLSIENDLESAGNIINALLQLQSDPTIKGILLHINCYGGMFGTTQAIFNEIKKIKKTKPVIVIIENICYSCAYYLAAASDYIFALPSSELGSIGVIRTIRHYKDLKFNENNVSGIMESTVITSGFHKSSGSRYVPLNDEQKQHLEHNSQKIYAQFISDVAQSRGLSLKDEKIWADGKEFVGTEALELGLIDELGGFTDALEKMKEFLKLQGISVEGNLEIVPVAV